MAIRLNGWLSDKFEAQLLLGNNWLQNKNSAKAAGIKSEYSSARGWRGLYHDNGSCLDITHFFPPDTGSKSALQVLQPNPLILTDGKTRVNAHLDSACIRAFLHRFPHLSHLPAQAVLLVRSYTIRYTSYGPPRHRLRLILHTVDWIAISNEPVRAAVSVPLEQVNDVSAVLQQLNSTRAAEDCRCLRPSRHTAIGARPRDGDPGQGEEGEKDNQGDQDEEEGIMAPTVDEGATSSQSQQSYTQAHFATQTTPAMRAGTSGHELRMLGVNRMDPVIVGNTRQEDLPPTSAHVNCHKLLDMLRKTGIIQPPSPDEKGSFQQPKSISTQASPLTPSRTLDTKTQRQTPSVRNDRTRRRKSPKRTHSQRHATETEARSPITADSPKGTWVAEEAGNWKEPSETSMECPWMKGFVFNSHSVVPDAYQMKVLNRSESWYKTQPGIMPFQKNNMPMRHFRMIRALAEENAAAQGQTQSDEEIDDSSPDSDSEGAAVVSSPESLPKTSLDDMPGTSQISWSASSTPEPPQIPASIKPGLPPDSSLEMGESAESAKNARILSSPAISLVAEKSTSAPPSSPPAMEIPADSDDEMEMETSVPQALNETRTVHVASSRRGLVSSQSPRSKLVVQVQETPHARSKQIHVSPEGKEYVSTEETKNSSSMSIVFDTHDESVSTASAKYKRDQIMTTSDAIGRPKELDSSPSEEPGHADRAEPARQSSLSTEGEIVMIESSPRTEAQMDAVDGGSISGHTAEVPDCPSRMSVSGSTKRKLAESPTKSSRRNSKRREIKLVGFGNYSPPSTDPALALRKDRADSLQRFRETRKSSTSYESRAGSLANPDADSEAMDVDASGMALSKSNFRTMSPRHQSLYDEPSPLRPLPKADQAPVKSSHPSREVAQSHTPTTGGSLRRSVQSKCTNVDGQVTMVSEPSTIFEKFRAAYPEYAGNEKHFKGQCLQMYQLDQEDKMVPKWQWDDFIIRHRADYRQYLLECVDNGEEPEPYYRFYKDTIRDTLYRKCIVDSRKNLFKALEELGAEPPASHAKEPRQDKSSRASLPSASTHHIRTPQLPEAPRQRPRHSLPVIAHIVPRTSMPSLHTPAFRTPPAPASARKPTSNPPSSESPVSKSDNLLSSLSRAPTPSSSRTPESSGDPFRDYFFAVQRVKSLTGSDTVDRNKPWPQSLEGRPTVADAPKQKVDVLTWGDVL
ncbi:hypothetical protein LEMA_P115630.1 [Plenodomus lingam JN3]|uniref:Telomere replication protein EST3 n=2 Tax=Leptosphaeria maculans TaxID=5022 RepID=E4ZUR9_LEPMJ|nr:hypothetical protein LEMA_P115630.1 [Plenodomus lingam JN3]CBX95148.1 hypothetical protein LEMA_P115630.1 [Plenodomus lingam JN3]